MHTLNNTVPMDREHSLQSMKRMNLKAWNVLCVHSIKQLFSDNCTFQNVSTIFLLTINNCFFFLLNIFSQVCHILD